MRSSASIPNSLGNPYAAAGASAGSFGVGALVPLMPWFFAHGGAAVVGSLVLGALAAVFIGMALARFTGRSALRTVIRQLFVTVSAAAVTYVLGTLVGSHLG